ncbi:hypothetical protein LQW54_004898 [Pestalotiopsis sp. IQ-011]
MHEYSEITIGFFELPAQNDPSSELGGDEQKKSNEDEDAKFEATLKNFQELFQLKQDSMDLYTAKVVQICNESLRAANIRHTAIASRIKLWKSAESSIRRPTVTTPFESAHEMLDHLYDFGGARISLYFPGDVERISRILQARFRLTMETRKHESMDVVRTLQRRLQDLSRDVSVSGAETRLTERSFSGYKATHFRVQLHDKDIPPERRGAWANLVVEIQVGTLVMHAWSEIEHNMIYKPLESQSISEDEVRLLDLINGIVATGESALRQLEESTKRRRNERAKDKEAFATSRHELGYWLEKHWVEAQNTSVQGDWDHLSQLYAVLKATEDHQLGKIQWMLGKLQLEGTLHRRMVPAALLEAMCKPLTNLKEPSQQETPNETVLNHARFWATHLVHSLNMALFLGVAGEFVDVENSRPRPQIADILDIIHPTLPRYEDLKTLLCIANYCRNVLKGTEANLKKKQLARIAACLSRTDRVVTSSELGGGLLVPARIVGLFVAEIGRYNEKQYGRQEMIGSQVRQSISFIEYYVSRDTNHVDNLAVWDRLTSTPSEETSTAMDDWFLVPNLSQREHEVPWKLVARPLHLDVAKPSTDSSIVSYGKSWRKDKSGTDEILELEYRLHPQIHWDTMDNQRIRIAIIGGGLAGATVANALFRLQHVDVHVFESAPEFSERGAAVGLSVNAQQALNQILPDYKQMLDKAGAVPMSSSRTILLVAINSKASGIAHTFEDDTKYDFDAVIGAEGIFSSVRRHIFQDTTRPEDYEPSPAGFRDCRSLVPIDKAKIVLGEHLFNDDRRYSWLGTGAFFMHDILEDKTMVQCIVSAIEREQPRSDSRKQILTRESLTNTLHAWLDGPIAGGIIDLTLNDSSTDRYSQWEHKVTPTYANDRVCIMGDAAHASTPWMGAGAGIALEDAMLLGKLIAKGSSTEEIAAAFKAYDALRRPRCQKVVDKSRDTGLLFCGEYGLDVAELRAQISTRWNFILPLDMEAHIQEALEEFARIKNSE